MQPASAPDRLVGWKEIAGFLKKSVRTVQRWERELGLPVRRVRTSDAGQSVFADPRELDDWLARQSQELIADNNIEPPADEAGDEAGAEVSGPVMVSPPEPPREATNTTAATASRAVLAAVCLVLLIGGAWIVRHGIRAQPLPDPETSLYLVAEDAVHVMNLETGEVTHRIRIPENAPYSQFRTTASFDSHHRVLTIPTLREAGVAIFDVAQQRYVNWYPVNLPRITRAQFSRDGSRLAVGDQDGPVHVVDAGNGAVASRLAVPEMIFDMVRDAGGDGVWIPSRDAGRLTLIDLRRLEATTTIATPRGAHDLAMAAAGRRAVTANLWDGSVSCVHLAQRAVTATVKLPGQPRNIALSSDDRVAYVASHETSWIAVVDAVTCELREVVRDRPGAGQVMSVAVAPSGSRLYVARSNPTTIDVLAATSPTLALIETRVLPFGVHIATRIR